MLLTWAKSTGSHACFLTPTLRLFSSPDHLASTLLTTHTPRYYFLQPPLLQAQISFLYPHLSYLLLKYPAPVLGLNLHSEHFPQRSLGLCPGIRGLDPICSGVYLSPGNVVDLGLFMTQIDLEHHWWYL